jgi:hypothetical protein
MSIKSTDIPNGYAVLSPAGDMNILVDFDENGKADTQGAELVVKGWPDDIMVNGLIRPDILVLVHTIKGESQMLVKKLKGMQLAHNDRPITVKEVHRIGKLTAMAEKIWKDYMVSMETMTLLQRTILEAEAEPSESQ